MDGDGSFLAFLSSCLLTKRTKEWTSAMRIIQIERTLSTTASCLLIFLTTICSCFLQSPLLPSVGELNREIWRRNTALWDVSDTFTFSDVANHGITSLLSEEDHDIIIVGTKSGDVYQSTDDAESWTRLSGYDRKPKYPVYSLAVETNGDDKLRRIFCGRGDRYISVWDTETGQWVQRLGPHTGWVQDLGYDETSQYLYSIGCNCIEVWDCSGRDTEDGGIRHISKLSVENSVHAATLSSDLLKLCLIDRLHCTQEGDEAKRKRIREDLLLSTGVDGRIHFWDMHRPQASLIVHQGRVNALTFSSTAQILFSVGNDGKLCASRINLDSTEEIMEVVGKVEIKGTPRLTAVTILEDEKADHLSLMLGTTDGNLICVAAAVSSSDKSITLIEGETVNVHESAKIYGVQPLPKKSTAEVISIDDSCERRGTRVLLVGHAKGMVQQICRPQIQFASL